MAKMDYSGNDEFMLLSLEFIIPPELIGNPRGLILDGSDDFFEDDEFFMFIVLQAAIVSFRRSRLPRRKFNRRYYKHLSWGE